MDNKLVILYMIVIVLFCNTYSFILQPVFNNNLIKTKKLSLLKLQATVAIDPNILTIIKSLETKFPSLTKNSNVSIPSSNSLLKDIDLLYSLLGEIIQKEDPKAYELFERYRKHAVNRSLGDTEALSRMISCASNITPTDSLIVVRAFTQMLNLINAAEVHNRARQLRILDKQSERISPLPLIEDSVAGTLDKLLQQQSSSSVAREDDTILEAINNKEKRKQQIYEKLLDQKVDIVLTAHPTEVNRKTLLRKYRTITEVLTTLDSTDLTGFERMQALKALKREIASIWGSDEIRRQRPSPQQEARGGIAILESVLWDAVPSYLRKLNLQCEASLGRALPLSHVPVRFSSWMGGDRDGNPNVTPKVTFEVAVTQRMQVAKLILNDVIELYKELAICKDFSSELKCLAVAVTNSFDRLELYRRVLGQVRTRLTASIQWCEQQLSSMGAELPASLYIYSQTSTKKVAQMMPDLSIEIEAIPEDLRSYLSSLMNSSDPLFDSKDLLTILETIHSSLVSTGYADVADGRLTDLIRRVATFGLTLVPLDIRQESTRHTMALDAITTYLGIGSYDSWDEATRINWLMKELETKRPFFHNADLHFLGFDELVLNTLETIQIASNLGPGSLGAYVISQSKAASDVLAVMLLQQQFSMTSSSSSTTTNKMKKMMRVVPLFETLTDLNNAPSIVNQLFSLPNYLDKLVNYEQEIMVGYSDSAKDAGRLAACWAQYVSQEQMGIIANSFGVNITFFHGKGGTVGRGGNPALYRAVLAHPPNTINGRFRVTEQGEMITQNFGSTNIAERTLDIYTAAVLAESFVTHIEPSQKWRNIMDKLSDKSCNVYRLLLQDPGFVSYFRTATPELELGRLNIGSRPTKRNPKGGIESLRAIPWTFAWTQIRLHLPAWLGVGSALIEENEEVEGTNSNVISDKITLKNLQEMYKDWPFFKEMIDLIAMTLSKTDYSISTNYELQLLSANELDSLGEHIRQQLLETRKNVLEVTGCNDLSSNFELLQQSMQVRYPYVDPLNILQAEIIKRLRLNDLLSTATATTTTDATTTATTTTDATLSTQVKGLTIMSLEDQKTLEDTLLVSINGIAQGIKNSG